MHSNDIPTHLAGEAVERVGHKRRVVGTRRHDQLVEGVTPCGVGREVAGGDLPCARGVVVVCPLDARSQSNVTHNVKVFGIALEIVEVFCFRPVLDTFMNVVRWKIRERSEHVRRSEVQSFESDTGIGGEHAAECGARVACGGVEARFAHLLEGGEARRARSNH